MRHLVEASEVQNSSSLHQPPDGAVVKELPVCRVRKLRERDRLTDMTTAAKCHENHVIITTENNKHIRDSLMFIATSI